MAEKSGCIVSPNEGHDLAVCIVSQEDRDADEALSIDSELGFFRVPMDVNPAIIYRYIQVQPALHRNSQASFLMSAPEQSRKSTGHQKETHRA